MSSQMEHILQGKEYCHHEEEQEELIPNNNSLQSMMIISTTIIVEDKDVHNLTIHQYRQAQLVDIQYKLKKLKGESCTPIIIIRRCNGEELSDSYKQSVLHSFQHFSRNIRIYFDEIESYLQSFGDFVHRAMRKRKLIQKVPTFDSNYQMQVLQKTIVKMYLQKPYPMELEAYNDYPIYIPVVCNGGLQNLFSCVVCEIVYYELRLYETNGNELILCNRNFADNLALQNQRIGSCLMILSPICFSEARVNCSIIPHDLFIVLNNYYTHKLNTCYSNYWYSLLDQYCPNQSEREILQFNSRKFESMDEVNYYIETTFAGKQYAREVFNIHCLDLPVTIHLDVNISSKMLRSKIVEKKPGNEFEIAERVRSILIERDLGFDYGFVGETYSTNNTVSLENRWCLMLDGIREWLPDNQITDMKIKNLIRRKKKIIISRNAEFTPKERLYNYLISSTFILCFIFFKENHI